MDKLIPILIFASIVALGFIMKCIELSDIAQRIKFTQDYRDKFITLVNGIFSNHNFNQQLYYELTLDINSMQYELGSDGIYVYATDNLKGVRASNYQLLINFLSELRNALNEQDNSIMMARYNQSIQDCDDMFIRHLGTLQSSDKLIRKHLFNPLSCFSDGMKFIVSLPVLVLNWFGFISDNTARKAKHNWFIKSLSLVASLVGFTSSIMSIIMGWSEFLEKM